MVNTLHRSDSDIKRPDFIDIHTHKPEYRSCVLEIVNYDPSEEGFSIKGSLPFTAGLHPWNLSEESDLSLHMEVFNHQALLGIGETGIDRRCSTPVEIQKSLFRDHITLSEKLKKPLIIHCVKSASDIVSLFKQSNIQQNWLIHGFNGRTGAFDMLASQGFHFSFGADLMLSDSNSSKHIKQLPLSRVLLETDDSDVPIEEVYRAASEILMLDISRLRGIIMDNFCRFFGVKDVSQLAGKNGTTG